MYEKEMATVDNPYTVKSAYKELIGTMKMCSL